MSKLAGILPVLQTPFDDTGEIDHEALARLVEFAIVSGADGVVYPANASEFFSLGDDERLRATETVAVATDGRVDLIICASGVSARHAASFATQAATLDATAVMALPPYTRRPTLPVMVEYFYALAEASNLPLVLQNVGPPLGAHLDVSGLDRLLDAVPTLQYIKEERIPTTHRISQLRKRYPDRLCGIIGGANGQWLVQEALRGACGCMPAGALIDVQVPIQAAVDSGEWEAARAMQATLQPLLAYLSLYGVTGVKEVLVRRGVIHSARTRDPEAVKLDAADRAELDLLVPALPPIDTELLDRADTRTWNV